MRKQRVIPAMMGVVVAAGVALAGAPGCGTEPGSDFDDGGKPTKPSVGEVGGNTGGTTDGTTSGSTGIVIGGDRDASGPDRPIDFDAGCASAEAIGSASPVYMLIVLDASGSMTSDDKWDAAAPAIGRFFDDVHTKKDTNLGVGLMLYQGTDSQKFPRTGDVMDTRIVDDAQWTRLKSRIGQGNPSSNTPTLNALTAAYSSMVAFKSAPSGPTDTGFADAWSRNYAPLQPGGRKVVILASDGLPTPQDSQDDIEASVAVNLKDQNVLTFAIGIGPFPGKSGYDPAFMGRVAQAGGTAVPNCKADTRVESEVCHFQVTPGGSSSAIAEKLLAAINAIRKVATGCEFNLTPKSGTKVDPSQVSVIVKDGTGKEVSVSKDPQNGWSYDNETNPTKVFLKGNACESVRKDDKASVRIVLGCNSPVPS